MAASSDCVDPEQFTCSICLDILADPVVFPCGHDHIFCKACIIPLLVQDRISCTLCRQEIDIRNIRDAIDVKKQITEKSCQCHGCKQVIRLSLMRNHIEDCPDIDRTIQRFKPVVESAHAPSDVPNRSTFECPFCHLKNLDNDGLLNHCNEQHSYNTASVVCPVCASMPWGSTNLRSSNFIQHLNHRHRFEYDTYVEYEQDEDAMIQAAIQASLEA